MDLRVSVVLLFIFLTGGYSLKCYTCTPDDKGSCAAKETTCPAGNSGCASSTAVVSIGSTTASATVKECVPDCGLVKQLRDEVIVTSHCCDTDLCNAADGVYKGSFLLLLSPLLFYFLFQ